MIATLLVLTALAGCRAQSGVRDREVFCAEDRGGAVDVPDIFLSADTLLSADTPRDTGAASLPP